MIEKILNETTTFCNECASKDCCPENECVLYRIEQIVHDRGKTNSCQCFHCLSNTVHWDNDFSFEDYGLEGEGIINVCHCSNCGAEIEYKVSFSDESEE